MTTSLGDGGPSVPAIQKKQETRNCMSNASESTVGHWPWEPVGPVFWDECHLLHGGHIICLPKKRGSSRLGVL